MRPPNWGGGVPGDGGDDTEGGRVREAPPRNCRVGKYSQRRSGRVRAGGASSAPAQSSPPN
eukprot:4678783-Prymnesium_polylepis.1